MGAPKKQKRKYETPPKPYDRARLERERKMRQDFGLRRKKEIWRAESMLRSFRQRARALQARRDEEKEKALFATVRRLGLPCKGLDEVLEIRLEDMLARRLQTIVHRKGLAQTARQARQLIVHGHVSVGGRKVVWPSYIVGQGQDGSITLDPKIMQAAVKEEQGGKP